MDFETRPRSLIFIPSPLPLEPALKTLLFLYYLTELKESASANKHTRTLQRYQTIRIWLPQTQTDSLPGGRANAASHGRTSSRLLEPCQAKAEEPKTQTFTPSPIPGWDLTEKDVAPEMFVYKQGVYYNHTG